MKSGRLATVVLLASAVFALVAFGILDARIHLGARDAEAIDLFGDETVQFTPAGRLLRGNAILFAHGLIANDAWHYLLGMGPGATSESRLAGATGELAQRYPGYAIDRVALSMILAVALLAGTLLVLSLPWYLVKSAGLRRKAEDDRNMAQQLAALATERYDIVQLLSDEKRLSEQN